MVPSEPAYYYPQPPMDQMGNGMMLGAHPHPHAMHMNMWCASRACASHEATGPGGVADGIRRATCAEPRRADAHRHARRAARPRPAHARAPAPPPAPRRPPPCSADSMQPRAHYVLGPAAPPVPYGPHAHMPPAGVPMGAMPAAVPHLWVVRMRGLPFDATEDEIADFFYPLDLAPGGIALRYQAGAHGARPSGEAFVAFRSAEVRVMALERNKQNLRSRYIELFEASESDFFAHASPPRAAAGLLPGRGRGARGGARGGMDGRGGARGGGMPQPMPPAYYAPSPAAMAPQMMPPSAYMPAQPQPMHHPAAMGAHMHMQPHGAPPPYGYAPYAYAPQPPHAAMAPMGGQQPAPGGAGSRTVRMRGLPFTATDGNVAAFFAPLQPTSIALGRNANGGLTGEAHVSFASEHDARAAMARNRCARARERGREREERRGARGAARVRTRGPSHAHGALRSRTPTRPPTRARARPRRPAARRAGR